ncbi:retinol-binding protein 3-like [Megalops cyprinoides]|uniref:retinol-binding protein 3-like n=1 Tax=Megalops cyprinoides TaxID=118141 RepID=UPI0018641220|nr:retinol-binding protein 3-like [Megalops cyprinoides]
MARPPLFLGTLTFFSAVFAVWCSFQPALVLDMAKILLDNYCFPENLVGMQEAIQQAINSGEILRISDPKTLSAVLTAGVQGALNDPRLTVSYEPNAAPAKPPGRPRLSPERLIKMVKNSVKFEVLENNIGYLRMDRIMGKEVTEKIGSFLFEYIWNRVSPTSALIFDLRYATSGEILGIPYIVSYFSNATPPIHIESVYDRPSNSTKELWTLPAFPGKRYGTLKDLIILVSKRTMGAAESIAYTLKHLHRAIVVGERSAGGSVSIEKLRIGESKFYITVPVARSINPITGQSWEVSGVSPSVTVNPKDAVEKAKSIIRVRGAIPKAVQSISDIISQFYSFTDRVPALLQQFSSADFFSAISEEDLAAKLNYELQSLTEDPRLIVKIKSDPSTVTEDFDELAQLPGSPALQGSEASAEAFRASVLPRNTGYLRFDDFGEVSNLVLSQPQVVRKALDSIKGTENLVLDLRSNPGGPSEVVPLLLSYLHDPSPTIHFYTIYSRVGNTTTEFHSLPSTLGPPYGSKRGVYVLTSHYTATAAEEFAYLMQSLNRATVIGEITSGTLLHSKSFQVEGTDIFITVPIINLIDNNGECWLGGGVVPDAIVLAEEALDKAFEIIAFHPEVHSLVEGTGELVESHYAIMEVAAKVPKVLRSKWVEGLYRSVVDYESLASELTTDLHDISGDHRLHVFYSDIEPDTFEEVPKIPTAEELGYIINDLFKTEVLPGNMGYLRYDMMADVETVRALGPQLVKLVWSKLVNTDALIIDMRYNTGGYSTSIPLLCSYFFEAEPPRHLYTVFDRSTATMTKVMTLPKVLGRRYSSRKGVYILTSHMTGSAAEVFTRAMKDLNRTTVIGEPTIGGSLSSGTYQIGNSPLYASVPTQAVLSAVTGKVWSISGVEPHVTAPANEALSAAQKVIRLRAKVPSIVKALAALVADNYAFPAIGAEVAEKLIDLAKRGHYSMVSSEAELGAKLCVDLGELSKDKNVRMAYIPEPSKANVGGTFHKQIPPPEALAELIKVSFHTDVFENNVGYLRFDSFGDFEVTAKVAELLAEHVWNKIKDTEALILDLRYNVGGSTASVPGLCSYFFYANQKILLDKLYNRSSDTTMEMWTSSELMGERYGAEKKVIVLTSAATAGAAEEFAHVLKKHGRATVIGRATSGGSQPPTTFQVDGTDLYLSLPVTRSDTPSWEGVGVFPHIPVPTDDALNKAKEILNKHLRGGE